MEKNRNNKDKKNRSKRVIHARKKSIEKEDKRRSGRNIEIEIIENWRNAIKVLFHPGRNTVIGKTIKESLKFYYSIIIIPVILGIILSFVLQIWYASLIVLLYLLIIFPLIGILVSAGIYHIIVSKLFRFYKGRYEKVVNAFTFSIIPAVFIYWIVALNVWITKVASVGVGVNPVIYYLASIDIILMAIIEIWVFIVLIFALSNQLSISKLKSIGTVILEGVIVFVAILVGVIIVNAITILI